jgi:NAD(P)-dependent dehydrogenase (short-subunit alcohol dehydrogenase family)
VAADAGPDVAIAEADTRDVTALAAAVAEAERRWGGPDAAIAVAGVIAGGVPAWEVPPGQR